jgi:hypothetical protein
LWFFRYNFILLSSPTPHLAVFFNAHINWSSKKQTKCTCNLLVSASVW